MKRNYIQKLNVISFIIMGFFLFISTGCGPGRLNEGIDTDVKLSGITFDGTHLYGVDRSTNELVKFDLNSGNVLRTYSVNHECVRGIAYFNGVFWITTCIGKVIKITGDGEVQEILSPENYLDNKPDFSGIEIVDYRVFIIDRNKLVEFDTEMTYVTDYLLPSKHYKGITYNYENLILTSVTGKLLYFDYETGEVISEEKITNPTWIYGVCWDGEKLWFSSPNKLKLFNLTE